jgi:hypothetical protein
MNLFARFRTRHGVLWGLLAFATAPLVEAKAASTLLGTDYIDTRSGDCQGKSICVVTWPNVLERKELFVTRVTCVIDLQPAQPPAIRQIVLGRKAVQGTPDPHTHLTPIQVGTAANLHTYQVNNATAHPFPAGARPQVEVIAYGTISRLSCTLMGTYRTVAVP